MPSIIHPPTITSNGGGDSATISVPENLTAVTIVTATDPDPGTTLQYSIAGGADASLFHIDAATGALSLIAVPDYEAPGDANGDNTYDVIVRASDGSLSDDQTLHVNIQDAADSFVPVTRFGGEFLVNTTTQGHQYGPWVTAFSDGRFVSVWTDLNSGLDDSSGGAIRGQIFDATGAKLGSEFLVNTTTVGQQNEPSVTMLSDGRFVVSWADYSAYGDAGSGPAVRAQIFNSSGSKSGGELFISNTFEGPAPVTAALADGRFVMAWNAPSATDTDDGIRAQVFNSNGTKSGAEFQVNTTKPGLQYGEAITVLNNGDFVISWTDQSATGADQSMLGVRGQIFHQTGAPVGGEFLVNTTTLESQAGASITALADGRFVAAWTDWSETGGDTDGTAVRGQVFNADGSKSGAEFLIDSTTTLSNQWTPSIAGLPDGRFVAAWLDASTSPQGGSNHAIRAQVFNSDGSKSSVELLVDASNSLHFAPTVTALADGRFVVNWSDQRQADGDTSGMGVRGQIFDPRGAAVHLTGTPGNDDFVGTRFDDSFTGGAGNDHFNAGAGNDTAIFSQSFSKYAIQALGSATLLVSGPDGGDTLVSVEHLQFSDRTLDAHNGALIALDLDSSDLTGPGTGYATMLTQPGVPVSIVGNIQTQDINPNGDQTITAARVVLTNAHAGDSLSISGNLPNGMTSTIDSSVPGVITLTLSGGNSNGLMSHADYQAALSHITFSNSNAHPNTAARDISVTVSENGLDSNVAHSTVHIMSAPNEAPVAQNGSASGNEDTTITGTLPATDSDGISLTFSPVAPTLHGSVTVNANGTFSYTPDTDFNGTDSFTFRANDGGADSNVATITLTVNPVNDVPAAHSASAIGNEDTTIDGTILASDIDSASLTYSTVAGPTHGSLVVTADGAFSYTPDTDFNGTDSFTFKANDGAADSNVATISLTVNAVNDAPLIVSDAGGPTATLSIPENTTAVTTVAATDIDSTSVTYSIVGGTDADKFHIDAATGVLSFLVAPNFENPTDAGHDNSYLVRVLASDGLLWDDQAITVSVRDVNESVQSVHWGASVDVGAHPAGWSPAGIGDFNHDGSSDLAWFNSTTGDIDVWELANGRWAASSSVGSHPAGYQPVGYGDYDHDGTTDVLWFNPTTREVDLWEMSNGKWAGSVGVGPHPAGYVPSGTGDFNGDGTSDVLWFNPTTRDVEIWEMSDGHWAASSGVGSHPAGSQLSIIGDFNGDGTSDMAWFNPTTGDVDVWKMADGKWAGSVDVGSHPAGYQPLGAADLNKDGISDIIWYNPTTNDVDIWLLNSSDEWSASVSVGSHPAGAVPVGVGDFDHNGVTDIMWQNSSTGHIENWMLAFS